MCMFFNVYVYISIYIYIYREREGDCNGLEGGVWKHTCRVYRLGLGLAVHPSLSLHM